MGEIYQKTMTAAPGAEQCYIGLPREGFIVPLSGLPQWGTWTELRIGLLVSHTIHNNANAAVLSESVSATVPSNAFTFGLKTHNDIIPGVTGTDFFGFGTHTNGNAVTTPGTWYIGASTPLIVHRNGALTVIGAPISGGLIAGGCGAPANVVSFCQFLGMRIKINNRGGATQSLEGGYIGNADATTYSDPTKAQVTTLLTSMPVNAASGNWGGTPHPWHDAGVPRAIPNALWLRSPFALSRFRVHALKAMPFA